MFRKLIVMSGLFMMLVFAALSYADSCPGNKGYPIDRELFTSLKEQGVPISERLQANHFLEVHAAKLLKSP